MSKLVEPIIYIFLGLPGSGKSYFSQKLSEKLGVVRFNSDSMRVAIFGSRQKAREIYLSGNREILNSYVFNAMDYATEELLAQGQSVIQDANHNELHNRLALKARAAHYNGSVILIYIKTPKEVAVRRGHERPETKDQRKLSLAEVADIHSRHIANTDQPIDSELVIEIDGMADFEEQYTSFKRQLEQINE